MTTNATNPPPARPREGAREIEAALDAFADAVVQQERSAGFSPTNAAAWGQKAADARARIIAAARAGGADV